ncbi:restriction endonuclease subunit S [Aeromonas caviae]|nr:restriction endonuclease subunit S [Aeromonas caviae]MDH1399858.1 restriction endonuclease subunit S [Aeromonas caviae]
MAPKGWKKESLSGVTVVIDCKHRTPTYVESGIPLVSPGTIKWGALDLISPVKRVSDNEYYSLMDHCTVDIGDLVMSRNQSIGVASYVESNEPFVLGQDTVLIKPIKADSKFVFYKLQSEIVQRNIIQLAGGSTFSRINLADIRKLKLNLPPLPEQKKIAQILSTWDQAISTTEQLLANSQQQKKALMQQLLTGKKRLLDKNGVRFSGEWKAQRIGSLLKEVKRPVQWDDDSEYHLLSVKRRSEGVVLREILKGSDILTKKMNTALAGDFLISKMQVVHGATGLVTEEFNKCHISDSYIALRPKDDEKIDIAFFSWFSKQKIMYHKAFLCSYGVHIEKMTFNFNMFIKEKVVIPASLEEQKKISTILSTAEQEISALQKKLAALKQEKQALMQQLLTGKRRVKVEAAA